MCSTPSPVPSKHILKKQKTSTDGRRPSRQWQLHKPHQGEELTPTLKDFDDAHSWQLIKYLFLMLLEMRTSYCYCQIPENSVSEKGSLKCWQYSPAVNWKDKEVTHRSGNRITRDKSAPWLVIYISPFSYTDPWWSQPPCLWRPAGWQCPFGTHQKHG